MKKLLKFSPLVLSGLLAFSAPALSQDAAGSAVDDFSAEVDKLDGIASAVIPTAIGIMVFSGGAVLVKRVIFS